VRELKSGWPRGKRRRESHSTDAPESPIGKDFVDIESADRQQPIIESGQRQDLFGKHDKWFDWSRVPKKLYRILRRRRRGFEGNLSSAQPGNEPNDSSEQSTSGHLIEPTP
jgi:hypothetical protein